MRAIKTDSLRYGWGNWSRCGREDPFIWCQWWLHSLSGSYDSSWCVDGQCWDIYCRCKRARRLPI